MSDIDLSRVDQAALNAEVIRRAEIAEKAYRDQQYEAYKERQARYEAEDRAFCASIGITYDQYVDAYIHYDEVNEHRW